MPTFFLGMLMLMEFAEETGLVFGTSLSLFSNGILAGALGTDKLSGV
ncbi:hypothetical protein ACFSOV_21695 [Pedobacter petrophilus]